MPIIYERTIMAGTDIDDLFTLIWNVKDTAAAFKKAAYGKKESQAVVGALADEHEKAQMRLVNFILSHDIEFFDLISRGRDDTTALGYQRTSLQVVPYAWDEEANRRLTVREIYNAPREKEL